MAHNNRDLEINTNTEPYDNPVHEALQFYWGERCPEHEDGCPTCEAWKQYDAMFQKEGRNLMVDDMTRPRVDPEIQKAMLKLILQGEVK